MTTLIEHLRARYMDTKGMIPCALEHEAADEIERLADELALAESVRSGQVAGLTQGIAALTQERDQLRIRLDAAKLKAIELGEDAAMLRAERDAAAADRDALLAKRDDLQTRLTESALQVLAHSTQAHEAWEDAERYRWLREQAIDGAPGVPVIAIPNGMKSGYYVNEETADYAIDAARKGAP